MPSKSTPIVIIKKRGGHGGHHGGAWKVAYADFVTAMMSLFIVLWLMGSSDKVKKAVAGYFNDPKGTASLLGTTMAGNGTATTTEPDNNMRKLKEKLEQEIQAKKELEKLSKQIEITVTPEGLRIELIEGKDGTFYESGSAHLSSSGQELLVLLAGELKTLPNNLLIEGHTDSTQYSADNDYSNWELSADRANSARRLMQQHGVRTNQVTQVRGYADQMLRVKDNPTDPSNRRISILVKNENGQMPKITQGRVVDAPAPPLAAREAQKAETGGGKPPANEGNPAAQRSAPAKPSPAPPAATPGLMDKLRRMLPGAKK